MGYVAMRAAPLGARSAGAVCSVFYGFSPDRISRALPQAWEIATPHDWLVTRLQGVDGALHRMLGSETLKGDGLREAAELAAQAAASATVVGRPLAAANAAVPVPDVPHLALWQHCTVLRESRGDGHVAALTVAGLDPCESLALFGADNGLTGEYLRAARGWTEPDWDAAVERLADRDLLTQPASPGTGTPALTDAGRELRRWVEDRTDAAAEEPWRQLGPEQTDRLAELLTPLARVLAAENDVMRLNPMALDAATVLAD